MAKTHWVRKDFSARGVGNHRKGVKTCIVNHKFFSQSDPSFYLHTHTKVRVSVGILGFYHKQKSFLACKSTERYSIICKQYLFLIKLKLNW